MGRVHVVLAAALVALAACATIVVADGFQAPSAPGALFFEGFDDDSWSSRWSVLSEDPYTGVLKRTAGEHEAIGGDKGVSMSSAGKRHGMAANLQQAANWADKPIVFQYELRADNGLGCDGAYLKFISEPNFEPSKLNGDSRYAVMFGPDKCGGTNKVHFIFQHKNPKTGKFEEKHLKAAPLVKNDKRTHLYTLVMHPDNRFEIMIDGEHAAAGTLLDSFNPPVNPPKTIDDPNDKKPEDWVDTKEIDDPEDAKPEDWDETQPAMIIDESASKPSDWNDDEPATIPDPEATKPEDWDDEDDGEWEPPMIDNPKCSASGCGPWKQPMKRNPLYKGKWKPRRIPNPEYKGEWKPKQIDNPDFFEDLEPFKMEPVRAVALELLTNSGDIIFDNILVTNSESQAQELAEVFKQRQEVEKTLITVEGEPSEFGKMLDNVAEMAYANPLVSLAVAIAVALLLLTICWKTCLTDKKPAGDKQSSGNDDAKKTDAVTEDDDVTENKIEEVQEEPEQVDSTEAAAENSQADGDNDENDTVTSSPTKSVRRRKGRSQKE